MFRRLLIAAVSILCILSQSSAVADIIPVNPCEGEFLDAESFIIIVSVDTSGGESIDWDRGAEILLDGRSLGSEAEISPALIKWTPSSRDLADGLYGRHTISITLRNQEKKTVFFRRWEFTVLKSAREDEGSEAEAKRVKFGNNGRVFTEARQYLLNNRSSLELYAGGTYRGYAGKLRYSADLLVDNLNYSSSQDRNIYLTQVEYGRVLSLKLGDTHPDFHPTILSGKRIRGIEAGFRLITPYGENPVNFSFCFGRSRRAVEPDTYKRDITAARLSFGSGRIFQLGLNLLKGRDDPSSVSRGREVDIDTVYGDTLFKDGASAQDNLVIGGDVVARLFKKRLELFGDYALSFNTRDINDGPMSSNEISNAFGVKPIDLESFSGFFTYNISSTPVYPSLKGILNSSFVNMGFKLDLPMSNVREYLKFKYKLQGANYYSMGNTILGAPEHGFSVKEKLFLLSNRLVVDAEYARHQNNFDNIQAYPTVTSRAVLRASLFYSQSVPGVTLGIDRNTASNADSSYGFDNGVTMVNLTGIYRYDFNILAGTAQIFCGFSDIKNEWNTVSYSDTIPVFGEDSAMAFSTGVFGFNVGADISGSPVNVSMGFMANTGNQRILKMYSVNMKTIYRIIPKHLTADIGIQAGSTKMPYDAGNALYIRVPYGIDFFHAGGHSIGFDGYGVASRGKFDFVNMLRYEWRF